MVGERSVEEVDYIYIILYFSKSHFGREKEEEERTTQVTETNIQKKKEFPSFFRQNSFHLLSAFQ